MDSISGIKEYGNNSSLYKIGENQHSAINETSQNYPIESQIDTIDLSDESKNMLLADIYIYREQELVNKKFESGHKIDWDAVKKNLQKSMGGEEVHYSDSKENVGCKGNNVNIYMTLENFVHPDAAGLTFPGSFQPQINEYGVNKSIKKAESEHQAGTFMIKNMLTNISLHEIARALGRNGYSERQNDLMYKELKYPNFFTKPLKFSVEDRQMIDQFLNR